MDDTLKNWTNSSSSTKEPEELEQEPKERVHRKIDDWSSGMQDTSSVPHKVLGGTRENVSMGMQDTRKEKIERASKEKEQVDKDAVKATTQEEPAETKTETPEVASAPETSKPPAVSVEDIVRDALTQQAKVFEAQKETLIRDMARSFTTRGTAKSIARNAVDEDWDDLQVNGIGGDTLKLGPDGRRMWGTGGTDTNDFPWDKTCFGYSISGTTVTIYSGEIDRIAVSQTDVTNVANNNYIYVRRTISNDTMLVTKGASVPADDDTYKYYKLYQFSVASGTASIKLICRPFAIEGEGLPEGGEQYQVIQRDGDGDAVWGWVKEYSIKPDSSAEYMVLQEGPTGDAEWHFVTENCIKPATGAQYQVLQVDATGDTVFDWVRAHA